MSDVRAITVKQPRHYLAGCLHGDAWLSTGSGRSPGGYLCLRVVDQDFADTFARALGDGFGVTCRPRTDERGYHLVRTYNGHGRFDELKALPATTEDERAAWLRGLFDSEGNANLTAQPDRGPASWSRRVAFYSTDLSTLAQAASHLTALGIRAVTTEHHAGPGHLGTKPVYQLRVSPGLHQFAAFAQRVGSSIARKQSVLNALPGTYADLAATRRAMQAAGAATRRARRDAGGRY